MSSYENLTTDSQKPNNLPTQTMDNKTALVTTSDEANKTAAIPQSPQANKTGSIKEANLGSIWAATIINMATIDANAYHKIHESYDDNIQSAHKEYIKAVLEVCTYLADQKEDTLQISKEDDWEVINTSEARSGLGLPRKKYRAWNSLDLRWNTNSFRYKDGTRSSQSRSVSPDHPSYEFQEYIRKQMSLYSEYTLPSPELLRNESSSAFPVVDMKSLQYLDYRMSLMNYANALVGLVDDSTMLPRCQEVDAAVVKRQPTRCHDRESASEIQRVGDVFNYVLKETAKRGVFPEPIPKEQGPCFDKPRYYIAWCIASITTEMDKVDEMMAKMVKFAEQYFQRIKTFVDMDGEVIEKKSKWLDALKKESEIPEFMTTSGMVKSWFKNFHESKSYIQYNR